MGERVAERQRWSARTRAWFATEPWRRHEDAWLLILTLLIGTAVGLVVVAFILVTERLGARLYPAQVPAWHRLVVPLIGSLVSGWLLSRYFPNARGSGIPQTKTALFLHHGHITVRTVVGKFACSTLSLASGIALGREGPTVHVGAGIASALGRRLGLGPQRVKALVPIGTSAAIAAAFNTPLSAVLFTLEEILGDLHAPVLGSIVISSATSWAVLHLMLGDEPLFHVPAYQLVHPIELLVYAVLGVAGGLVSVTFVRLLLSLRRRFQALPKSTQWWQPAIGGLVVGGLGWFVPDVLGVGYAHVGAALNGRMLLSVMALLLALKVIATATCYASGNAGGIFGPSLFIGAMLGGTIGSLAHGALPDVTGSAGAYALVGMGTAFAGIVRAPMTSVIMIFEITRDYSIIVPVMLANLLSYFIARQLQPVPVYEALLEQDNIRLPPTRVQNRGLTVEQVMRAPSVTTDGGDSVAACSSRHVGTTMSEAWPVIDNGRLLGMLDARRLRRAYEGGSTDRPVSELLPPPPTTHSADGFPHVHPDQSVDVVLQRMGQSQIDVLPVVSRSDIQVLLGVVSLADLPRAFVAGHGQRDQVEDVVQRTATPRRAVASVVIGGVLGLAVLGGLIARQYHAARIERASEFYRGGQTAVQTGRTAEGIEQLRSALSLVRSDEYRLALGLALTRTDRRSEAALYLTEVLRTDPRNGPANLGVARLERSAGAVSEAAVRYRSAVAGRWPGGSESDRLNAGLELASMLDASGDRRQAVAELLRLSGQIPVPESLVRIGQALLTMGTPAAAADVFREVLAKAPARVEAFVGLGEAELAQDDYLASLRAFESAIRLEPSNDSARRRAAFCARILELDPSLRNLRSRDRYERSVRVLQAVITAVDACAEHTPGMVLVGPLTEARSKVATRHRPQSLSDGVDDNMQLASTLWSGLSPACGAPQGDPAVDRIVRRSTR
jgi:chloride channel protein, CIC family